MFSLYIHLPKLDIFPYSEKNEHRLENGIFLRTDWHRLLDSGKWLFVLRKGGLKIKLGDEMMKIEEYAKKHNKFLGEWNEQLRNNIKKTVDCKNTDHLAQKYNLSL